MRVIGLNKIFVEGVSDKLFIEAILLKYFEIDNKELVVDTKGKDKLKTQPDLTDERRIAENAKNLIIFDTDFIEKGGGREQRLEEYKKIASDLNTKFEIFLLPFDDEKEGRLEDLVKTCFNKDFDFFDGCWSNMIECFQKDKSGKKLNLPAIEGYLFSKVDLFKDYREEAWNYGKLTEYNYYDKGIWDLEINENNELKRLVDFIANNLFD